MKDETTPQPQPSKLSDLVKRSEGPTILLANSDGSIKQDQTAGEGVKSTRFSMRKYPDGRYMVLRELPKPGFLALCVNSTPEKTPDVLHQVGVVHSPEIGTMVCDAVNFCALLHERRQLEAEAAVEKLATIAPNP